MGSGIAQKVAQEGIEVVLVDIQTEFVDRGIETINNLLQQAVDRKILTSDHMNQTLSRITGTTDFSAVADADIVVEAVFEDKGVKMDLFKKLDTICAESTIFATNTSSFFVREFAEPISRPDRFIGLHYFFHPAKNRLLEVIPHDGTSQATLATARVFAKLHGKTAIKVKDAPGFAVNRFFVPFLNEAGRMLEEGLANIPTIEETAKRAFKIGMGAFELMNVTGIPIAVHAADTLGKELGPFYETAPIIRAQMNKNEDWDLSGDVDASKLATLMDRFYGVCLGVSAALVDEGVATVEDTDRGAKIGLRWLLGPFEIMNKIGISKTYSVVSAICETYPDFTMPAILEKQKTLGIPFRFKVVDREVKGDLAFITLNRPEAMNALNEAVVAQLEAQFSAAEKDPAVKGIVFQGAGKAFVAGADIRFFVKNIKADNIADIVAFTRKGHELLLAIEKSSKHTIALLDGLSLGGGSELALACQSIVATSAGVMGFPETGIGIFPGLGGMLRMARQVGPALAKYYVFTGAMIDAATAHALGIVTKIVAPAQVDDVLAALVAAPPSDKYRKREIPAAFTDFAAVCADDNIAKILAGEKPSGVSGELASQFAKTCRFKAPLALKLANDIIDRQVNLSIEDAVTLELGRLAEIFSTEDALEGLSTAGKKRPQFKGR
jgi:enoyl-CoA hydratase/3-hydroxyacyl-CoA dehydrogenase